MENFSVTDKYSSMGDNAEDIKTIAKSYLMYKIGKFSSLNSGSVDWRFYLSFRED